MSTTTAVRSAPLAILAVFMIAGAVSAQRAETRPADTQPSGGKAVTLTVRSPAFEPGKPIPRKHTGEGEDSSPELTWSDVPAGTVEIALIVDDPDAPRPQPWVHWVIYKIPPAAKGLKAGVTKSERAPEPAGALQGKNSWDRIGYGGPMPPPGHGVHHYHFKVYALDKAVPPAPGLTKERLLEAMKGHVLAEGELIGTYERK